MSLSIGRIVHYRVGGTDEAPELRPALVVRLFEGLPYGNLQVFVDGSNDKRWQFPSGHSVFATPECDAGLAWKTSVSEGHQVGQWRWPARTS